MTESPLTAQQHRWEHCKVLLAERLPADDAAAWLPRLQLVSLEPRRVVLGGVPNGFFKSRVEKQFRATVLECLRVAFPDLAAAEPVRLDCRIAGAPPAQQHGAAAPVDAAAAAGQLPLPLASGGAEGEAIELPRPGPQVTFESVVEGEANRLALQFARDVAAQPGQRFNPLYLAGPTGSGKTHLLQALRAEMLAAHPGMNVALVSGEAYKVEVLEAIQVRRMKPVREKYHAADALLVDDLQFLLVTPKAQEELLHTFDKLHGSGRQVVVSADRLPQGMTGLNETLRSRLEMGLVADLALPDGEARLRLVRSRAAREGMALPEPVAALLAEQIANPRQLVGALVRLAAYAALLRQPVTLEFARQYAAPFLELSTLAGPIAVTPEVLVAKVCDRFGIAQRALRSPEKSTALVRARQVVIYLLKDLGGLSYSEISPWVGNRATSTLSHAYQTARRQLAESPHLRRMVTQLRQELTHGSASAQQKPSRPRETGRNSKRASNIFR
jgi:chromosomal replication initiator protein